MKHAIELLEVSLAHQLAQMKRLQKTDMKTPGGLEFIGKSLSIHQEKIDDIEKVLAIIGERPHISMKNVVETLNWQLNERQSELNSLYAAGEENVVDYYKKIKSELEFIKDLQEINLLLSKHKARWTIL